MNTLLAVLVFIGTRQDLRAHRAVLEELNVPTRKVLLIRDSRALSRFSKRTGHWYRAGWDERQVRLTRNVLPDAVIVFGRETLSRPRAGMGYGGCLNGTATICKADDVAGCVAAVKDTWCRN